MSFQTKQQNVYNKVPRNCGIIVGERKNMGRDLPIQNGEVVIVVDPDTREIHTWNRKAYQRWMLSTNESPMNAWESKGIRDGRTFSTSRQMIVCPNELEHNGRCENRWDPTHRKHHYHFTKIHSDGKPHYAQIWVYNTATPHWILKPICKYSLTDKSHLCWERNNSKHNAVFVHK